MLYIFLAFIIGGVSYPLIKNIKSLNDLVCKSGFWKFYFSVLLIIFSSLGLFLLEVFSLGLSGLIMCLCIWFLCIRHFFEHIMKDEWAFVITSFFIGTDYIKYLKTNNFSLFFLCNRHKRISKLISNCVGCLQFDEIPNSLWVGSYKAFGPLWPYSIWWDK